MPIGCYLGGPEGGGGDSSQEQAFPPIGCLCSSLLLHARSCRRCWAAFLCSPLKGMFCLTPAEGAQPPTGILKLQFDGPRFIAQAHRQAPLVVLGAMRKSGGGREGKGIDSAAAAHSKAPALGQSHSRFSRTQWLKDSRHKYRSTRWGIRGLVPPSRFLTPSSAALPPPGWGETPKERVSTHNCPSFSPHISAAPWRIGQSKSRTRPCSESNKSGSIHRSTSGIGMDE